MNTKTKKLGDFMVGLGLVGIMALLLYGAFSFHWILGSIIVCIMLMIFGSLFNGAMNIK